MGHEVGRLLAFPHPPHPEHPSLGQLPDTECIWWWWWGLRQDHIKPNWLPMCYLAKDDPDPLASISQLLAVWAYTTTLSSITRFLTGIRIRLYFETLPFSFASIIFRTAVWFFTACQRAQSRAARACITSSFLPFGMKWTWSERLEAFWETRRSCVDHTTEGCPVCLHACVAPFLGRGVSLVCGMQKAEGPSSSAFCHLLSLGILFEAKELSPCLFLFNDASVLHRIGVCGL